ncbi:CPBP family intramembrane glutamic endopeptidase [Natrinema pallidum]|uniref:CAAX prenyl protease 2/Lysostaphin resistance protein A-like domain-containing protein n=1 Tax=Natrinema pallidum DSM 3751 TaxID=1227495 RepID=L9Z550_9EURY|nr:type II CAAX endopeptidase family protein [Natrinema pallidum]ELY80333.1 hypothetical protein C487_04910 [Natrinema pallidum DSM 3751]
MDRPSPTRLAAVVVTGWIVLEVTLRWGVVLAAARVGIDPGLADALVLLLGFPLIAAVLSRYVLERGREPDRWGWEWTPRSLGMGVLAAIVGFGLVAGASRLDAVLFGLDSAAGARDGLATTTAVLLLVGNGLVVPVAEEQVWRGIVQTELVEERGAVVGIGATAVLFALKHVIVDLSILRLTTLLTLAVLFGVVRHRWGTASSTVTHALINTVSTAGLVIMAVG